MAGSHHIWVYYTEQFLYKMGAVCLYMDSAGGFIGQLFACQGTNRVRIVCELNVWCKMTLFISTSSRLTGALCILCAAVQVNPLKSSLYFQFFSRRPCAHGSRFFFLVSILVSGWTDFSFFSFAFFFFFACADEIRHCGGGKMYHPHPFLYMCLTLSFLLFI